MTELVCIGLASNLEAMALSYANLSEIWKIFRVWRGNLGGGSSSFDRHLENTTQNQENPSEMGRIRSVGIAESTELSHANMSKK